jgi:hypothetical protein
MTVNQTSGSIALDMSGVAEAVTASLAPIVNQINANLEHLAGLLAASALDEESAVDALVASFPAAYRTTDLYPDMRAVAGFLAEHLAQQGYALVAVNGPALERELSRNGFTGVAVAPVVDPAARQRELEEQWFADGRTD